MVDIDSRIILGIVGLITGIYGWLLRHLFGKAQFKDVCEAHRQGLSDCIENEVKCSTERYNILKEDIDELKQMIRDK